MTEAADRSVVVVSGNHALIASLPFHCALPLEFDRNRAPDAAAVLVDLTGPRDPEDVLDDLGTVDSERIVVLADRPPVREVGVTLIRPVSVSDIGSALERVAESLVPSPNEEGEPAHDPPEEIEPPLEEPEVVDGDPTGRDDEPAAQDPSSHAVADPGAVGGVTGRREDLVGLSAPPDTAAGPYVVESENLDPPTTEGPDFRAAVGRATHAARELAEILGRHPILARPQLVIGELALDVAEAADLDMLGLWLLRGETFSSLGGHALRPTDERRQFPMNHPLVARACNDGGVVVAHIGDDPRVVSGLPGAYEDSVLLSPLTTAGGNVVMAVGGGTSLDGRALVRVEEALAASATVIDLAVAIEALLGSLEA